MTGKMETKNMLDGYIHRMAIVARIGVESEEYTKDEVMDEIRTEAEKVFNQIFSMDSEDFVMLTLFELINTMVEKGTEQ